MAIVNMNRKYCCSLNMITCFLFLVPFCTLCQPPESPPPSGTWIFSLTPSDNLILFAVIVFLAVYYFISNFLQRYPPAVAEADGRPALHVGRAWSAPRIWVPPPHSAGVDRSVVEAFPTFRFADVRDRRLVAGKSSGGELECAVCLSEFRGEETIRVLPRCSHVFHIGCIDSWLADHSNCPVCRSDLLQSPPPAADAAAPAPVPAEVVSHEVAIAVNNGRRTTTTTEASQATTTPEGGSSRRGGFRLVFWRSNSTGRSTTGNFERFTLRLPEEVRTEVALPGEANNGGGGAGGSGVASPPDGSASDGSVHRGLIHEKQVTPVKTE